MTRRVAITLDDEQWQQLTDIAAAQRRTAAGQAGYMVETALRAMNTPPPPTFRSANLADMQIAFEEEE